MVMLLVVHVLLMVEALVLRVASKLLLSLLLLVRLLRRALRVPLHEARGWRRTHGVLRILVTHYKKLQDKNGYGKTGINDH